MYGLYVFQNNFFEPNTRTEKRALKNRDVGYSQRVLQNPVLFSTRRHAAGKLQKMAG